jgi:hypothetical protein
LIIRLAVGLIGSSVELAMSSFSFGKKIIYKRLQNRKYKIASEVLFSIFLNNLSYLDILFLNSRLSKEAHQ